MMTSDLPVKFSKEVSDFIESNGSRCEDYFWFQNYYKKVGEGLFQITQFKDLPGELKIIVEQLLPRSEEDLKKIADLSDIENIFSAGEMQESLEKINAMVKKILEQ